MHLPGALLCADGDARACGKFYSKQKQIEIIFISDFTNLPQLQYSLATLGAKQCDQIGYT